ncbi:MAG TPA: hypothetical protein VFO95_09160 [Gemmatimonadales bacterium]|nr:hypothetical protein [Gemmatimonadales bacterium]
MRGATLLEVAAALVIIGLLSGLGIPRAVHWRDRILVQRHTQGMFLAYHRARLAALQHHGPALLRIAPDRAEVWRLHNGDSTLVWHIAGPAADGVSLSGPARVVFSPAGITLGVANGSYVLSRGGITRIVLASRLGRLRVTRPRRARKPGPRAP